MKSIFLICLLCFDLAFQAIKKLQIILKCEFSLAGITALRGEYTDHQVADSPLHFPPRNILLHVLVQMDILLPW